MPQGQWCIPKWIAWIHNELEQLERLRSEDTPAASWLPTLLSHVGSQVKTRSNDLEDIGQGQRSSHATHLLMLVIICTTYGKNPSGTVDATERTRFSRPRPNDLEDIGQGQRPLYATHSHISDHLCYIWKESNFQILKKRNTRHTL